MSTQDLVNYYADLLILQYVGKPKARATVQALVTPALMPSSDPEKTLPLAVRDAFDLSTAVGAQLDLLGKYAGVSRSGPGFTVPVTLGDADYRSLIRMAIVKNAAGSSLYAIQTILYNFFPGTIRVTDLANMQMNYVISSSVGSPELVQRFVTGDLLPKPMGVQLASLIYVPDITVFFGWRSYISGAIQAEPFNTYDSYQTTWPWLSYVNAVTY